MAKMLYKVAAFVLALVLAHFLMPVVAGAITEHTQLDDRIRARVESEIKRTVEEKVRERVNAELSSYPQELADQMKDQAIREYTDRAMSEELDRNTQIEVLKSLKLPEFARTALIENNNDGAKAKMGVEHFYEYVSAYAAKTAVNAVAYVATWLITCIALWVLFFLIIVAVKLPVIHTVDKFGGMVAGAAMGVLVVWALLAVASLLPDRGFLEFVNAEVEGSAFLSALNQYNPFVALTLGFTRI